MASHERGFYLGPPDRLWKQPPETPVSCLVHRSGCGFIESFIRNYDQSERFLPQIKDYVGDKIIYIANPTPAFRNEELAADDVRLREIFVIRDGRAVIHSAVGHISQRFPDFQSCLAGWMFPAIQIIYRQYKRPNANTRFVRYEDMVADPIATLNSLSDFHGVTYDQSALRYWEFEHHPTAGNSGTIDVLARMQGLEGIQHRRRDFYDAVLNQAREEPAKPMIDLTWVEKLTADDRLAYDTLMGPYHEFFGYERDAFTDEERTAFAAANNYQKLSGYPVEI